MLVLFGGVPGVLLGGRVADRWAPKMQGGRLALPAIFLFIGTTFFTAAYLFRSPPGVDEVTGRSPARPSRSSSSACS